MLLCSVCAYIIFCHIYNINTRVMGKIISMLLPDGFIILKGIRSNNEFLIDRY